ALIGPNGAGKSTTIKMISGILYPSEGTIDVMGYIPWLQRKEYVKHIGVVFGQKSQLYWDLPAIDTFALNKEMYKIPTNQYKRNLDYFRDLLELDDIIIKPVRNLSLGERMKCELVCSMLHGPELIYLDEPTIGLDLFAKESVRKFIKQINNDQGVTFILTTHDLNEIENLCHHITVINKGTIVYNNSIDGLQLFSPNKKTIKVKFSSPVEEKALSSFNVLCSTPFSAAIEIDLARHNLQDEVNVIFGNLPVQDINIESISIEEVIKEIYSQ
ncbi:MAG TPA: ATP-binding cassette domain-containing protein, partial [Bacillota bacterium]|nr:ATP-binding cassette domain-containing protein [Bacillota bacterium]